VEHVLAWLRRDGASDKRLVSDRRSISEIGRLRLRESWLEGESTAEPSARTNKVSYLSDCGSFDPGSI
jgi:hypothetical protein